MKVTAGDWVHKMVEQVKALPRSRYNLATIGKLRPELKKICWNTADRVEQAV